MAYYHLKRMNEKNQTLIQLSLIHFSNSIISDNLNYFNVLTIVAILVVVTLLLLPLLATCIECLLHRITM